MNALYKLRGFFLFCLIVLFAGSQVLVAGVIQKTQAGISRFDLPGYYRFHRINNVAFDDEGILYIASDYRISIFNGSLWTYVSTHGKTFVTCSGDGHIYFIDSSDFGTLVADSLSGYTTSSLKKLESFPGMAVPGSDTNGIWAMGDAIFLQNGGKVFILKDSVFTEAEWAAGGGQLKDAGGTLLLFSGEEIGYPDNPLQKPVMKGGLPANAVYRQVRGGFLAWDAGTGNFFTISDELNQPGDWKTEVPGKVLDFISSKNGCVFILNDKLNLFVTDREGNILSSIQDCPFSPDPESRRFVLSPYGQVWLVEDHCISIIDYPPAFTPKSPIMLPGNLKDFILYGDSLYIATDRGLFTCGTNYTRRVTDMPVKALFRVNDELLALLAHQICSFSNGKMKIFPVPPYNDAIQDEINGNLIFAADSGFNTFRPDGVWQYSGVERGIEMYIPAGKFIFFISDNRLFQLDTGTGTVNPAGIAGDAGGRGIRQLFLWRNEPYAVVGNTLRRISEGQNSREGNIINLPYPVIRVIALNNDKVILLPEDPRSVAKLSLFDAAKYSSSPITAPAWISPYSMRIKPVGDSTILVSGGERVFHINLDSPHVQKTYFPVITTVIAGKDTLLEGSTLSLAMILIRKKLNNIAYKNHEMTFVFSTTDFIPGGKRYQFSFDGGGAGWSEWREGNVLKFTDLHEGDYKLSTRFLNEEGMVSEPAEIQFIIRPPFLRSPFALSVYILAGLILFFILYKSLRYKFHRLHAVGAEQGPEVMQAAEILPTSKTYEFISTIDQEAKSKKTKWDKYEMATVLFSDIQGFTRIAEQMNPEKLIDELDKFFFHFDSVVEKYNIEKIKTIGDAYMAAGGIPKKNSSNPIEVVLAALEMQQYMKQMKKSHVDIWDLRIGIHSGPVIAGTIGQKKRSYDIWGDTVNTASRMESSGEGGKVNISGTTFNHIREYFICEYRGKLPVKYKGNIDMYFVKGLRPELSINLAGIPNRKFFLRLQILRLTDLEEYTYDRLENELPGNLYFHNIHYARQVYNHAGLLSKAEDLDLEEILMVRTASLLLPLGYINAYENPEKEAAAIARKVLNGFFYSDKQVNLISNLILSTRWPHAPRNLLEEIMADTSTEYLGRADFIKLYKLLFLEYNEYHEPLEIREWKELQFKILSEYKIFTEGARRLREVTSDEQIRKLSEDNW